MAILGRVYSEACFDKSKERINTSPYLALSRDVSENPRHGVRVSEVGMGESSCVERQFLIFRGQICNTDENS